MEVNQLIQIYTDSKVDKHTVVKPVYHERTKRTEIVILLERKSHKEW